ncbi:MAG TPA: O-antigen ligase family protein [Vicinamibacterales bacterium]|nr:O-antigen ligase family protein [Vicinamibacterales bacterium]
MSPPRERLAFNSGPGTVPSQQAINAALAADQMPTFATAQFAEPRDWGYKGLLAFTAVLLLRPQDTFPALVPFHLAEVCALISIAPMLVHRLTRNLPVFRITMETVALIAFGGVIVVTMPFSIWPGGVLEVLQDYSKIVIVFVLMMNTLTSVKRIEQLTWLILACCGYIAARGVFDYARGVNLVEGDRVGGAVGGIFGNPNDLALNMVTFLPVALMVALTPRHSTMRRLTAALIVALMLATVVFTKSRGGALGLGGILVAMLFFGRHIRTGFAAMAIGGVLLATPFLPTTFWDRMSSIFNEEQDKTKYTGSSEARRELIAEGIDTFMAFPLTGVGAGQFKNYNPPDRKERWRETHNVLIQVAAETGILGLLVFSFLVVRGGIAAAATRRLLAPPRKKSAPDRLRAVLSDDDRRMLSAYVAAMSAGFVGWFICSMFASVAYNWTFYYLLALIVAVREMARVRLNAARALGTAARRAAVPADGLTRPAARGVA